MATKPSRRAASKLRQPEEAAVIRRGKTQRAGSLEANQPPPRAVGLIGKAGQEAPTLPPKARSARAGDRATRPKRRAGS